MYRVWGIWPVFALVFSAPLAARDSTPLVLAKGARVGVINLLYAEVTHFHASKSIKDEFLKTESVGWPVDGMLLDALKDRAAQMGLTLVPLAVTPELDHAREACFLDGNFNKGLPRDCVVPLQHIGNSQQVQALIVLAPGLNNSTHAGSSRRKDLPDYLRGWGFVTGDPVNPSGKPTLFSMTEMLLVAPSSGGPQLRAREWGGNYSLEWSDFVAPPDLKAIPLQNFAPLQSLFAAILSRQAGRLMDQIEVGP